MKLKSFFRSARPFLQGRSDVRRFRTLGRSPSANADLQFYPWLVAFDQQRILGELMPLVKQYWVESGRDWTQLVSDYVRAHPPTGHSVPHVGQHLGDYLAARRETEPDLPRGIEEIADFRWTHFLARTAPDAEGLGLDRRVFVRRYTTDPQAAMTAIRKSSPMPEPGTHTRIIYRVETSGRTHTIEANLASIAVLVLETGGSLTGALLMDSVTIEAERTNLVRRGVIPSDAPAAEENQR